MSTERIDVEALRGRSEIIRITAEGTREVAAQCSADMRPFMHLRAAELEQIAGEYDALLAEVIERRARDAALAELVEAASAFTNDDRNRAWHPDYPPMLSRLAAALAAIQGAQP